MARDSPLVSVIIPTFNRAAELRSAIESALTQTCADFELLVCDDGSTDDTRTVVEALEQRDRRVRYLGFGRSGKPAVPRNRGLRIARGRWVAFLDSDDRWAPDKLEVQLAALSRTGAAGCSTNAYRVRDWNRQGHHLVLPKGRSDPTQASLIRRNTIITSSAVVDSACLRACGGFPESPSLSVRQDYALWLRVARLGQWVYVDEPLTYYHDAPQSSIRGKYMRAESRGLLVVFSDYRCWTAGRGERVPSSTRLGMSVRIATESLKDVYRFVRRTLVS